MTEYEYIVRYVSKLDGQWSYKCFVTRQEAETFLVDSDAIGSDAELFAKEYRRRTVMDSLEFWKKDSAAAWDRCEEYRKAVVAMLENLGVPQPGYPAPVAEAYRIGKEVLGEQYEQD